MKGIVKEILETVAGFAIIAVFYAALALAVYIAY